MNKNWDLIVAGGGTSAVAAAISAARHSCKVLVIEKNSFLGGTATGALVTPMMKNITQSGEALTTGIISEV
ncbi:MAG TPA: FAD-binding dehydrogenase, partial [Cyanobacteria bacterium UBA9971]|nr:FAD-binding dehydrogenase [Cyanobacteria bacterium UBA9971]